jgi:hypothetical protein
MISVFAGESFESVILLVRCAISKCIVRIEGEYWSKIARCMDMVCLLFIIVLVRDNPIPCVTSPWQGSMADWSLLPLLNAGLSYFSLPYHSPARSYCNAGHLYSERGQTSGALSVFSIYSDRSSFLLDFDLFLFYAADLSTHSDAEVGLQAIANTVVIE